MQNYNRYIRTHETVLKFQKNKEEMLTISQVY